MSPLPAVPSSMLRYAFSFLIGLLGYFCRAQSSGSQDPDNYFRVPPASDAFAWDQPWVLATNQVYKEGDDLNISWKTNHTSINLVLWKYDNNTDKGLQQPLSSGRSEGYFEWNTNINDKLKNSYTWPNDVYFIAAYVKGETGAFMNSHYFNITNRSIPLSSSSSISTSATATNSSPSPTTAQSSSSHTALASGLGGGLCALTIVAIAAALVFYIRQRRHSTEKSNVHIQYVTGYHQTPRHAKQPEGDAHPEIGKSVFARLLSLAPFRHPQSYVLSSPAPNDTTSRHAELPDHSSRIPASPTAQQSRTVSRFVELPHKDIPFI